MCKCYSKKVIREKVRLKRDANIEDIDFEEMLDDTQEKTKHYE